MSQALTPADLDLIRSRALEIRDKHAADRTIAALCAQVETDVRGARAKLLQIELRRLQVAPLDGALEILALEEGAVIPRLKIMDLSADDQVGQQAQRAGIGEGRRVDPQLRLIADIECPADLCWVEEAHLPACLEPMRNENRYIQVMSCIII